MFNVIAGPPDGLIVPRAAETVISTTPFTTTRRAAVLELLINLCRHLRVRQACIVSLLHKQSDTFPASPHSATRPCFTTYGIVENASFQIKTGTDCLVRMTFATEA